MTQYRLVHDDAAEVVTIADTSVLDTFAVIEVMHWTHSSYTHYLNSHAPQTAVLWCGATELTDLFLFSTLMCS